MAEGLVAYFQAAIPGSSDDEARAVAAGIGAMLLASFKAIDEEFAPLYAEIEEDERQLDELAAAYEGDDEGYIAALTAGAKAGERWATPLAGALSPDPERVAEMRAAFAENPEALMAEMKETRARREAILQWASAEIRRRRRESERASAGLRRVAVRLSRARPVPVAHPARPAGRPPRARRSRARTGTSGSRGDPPNDEGESDPDGDNAPSRPAGRHGRDATGVEPRERRTLVEAVEYLLCVLAAGRRPSAGVMAEGIAAGFSKRTLHRARRALHVRAGRVGFGPGAVYVLWLDGPPPWPWSALHVATSVHHADIEFPPVAKAGRAS